MAESYHLSFGIPVATFGRSTPTARASRAAPSSRRSCPSWRGQREIRLGDLRPTRDFTFVEDTARAFMAVADAPAEAVVGRTLNAGTGVEISIGDLVKTIAAAAGYEVTVAEEAERLRPAGSEVMRLVCDSSRLTAATGWKPTVSLARGWPRPAAWFSQPENLARYKWNAYTV